MCSYWILLPARLSISSGVHGFQCYFQVILMFRVASAPRVIHLFSSSFAAWLSVGGDKPGSAGRLTYIISFPRRFFAVSTQV